MNVGLFLQTININENDSSTGPLPRSTQPSTSDFFSCQPDVFGTPAIAECSVGLVFELN